jgi:hypothetical protein
MRYLNDVRVRKYLSESPAPFFIARKLYRDGLLVILCETEKHYFKVGRLDVSKNAHFAQVL